MLFNAIIQKESKLMQTIINIDLNIMNFIKVYLKCSFLDFLMPIVSELGNNGFIWITMSVFLIFNKKYRHIGIIMLTTIFMAVILGEGIIKHLVQRPRPSNFIDASNLLIKVPDSYSFPSGHTTMAFGSVFVFSKYFKKYKLYFFAFASIIGFSRIYLSVHYPSDVIGGVILGFISYELVIYLYHRYYKINFCNTDD